MPSRRSSARPWSFGRATASPPTLAVKIYKRYGENVRQVITRNPYRLVEDVEGIGFKTADRIAALRWASSRIANTASARA